MECNFTIFRHSLSRLNFIRLGHCSQIKFNALLFCSSTTDDFVDNLTLESGSKHELKLIKLFNTPSQSEILSHLSKFCGVDKNVLNIKSVTDTVIYLESVINLDEGVPNKTLIYILIIFSKTGNTNGVKAIQSIIKKYNCECFKSNFGYDLYLAEALWVSGRIEESLKLFLNIYENLHLKYRVKVILKCLFPFMISDHSEGIVRKVVYSIQQFSRDNNDFILLSCLWQELFKSKWFSDQQLAQQILDDNFHLLSGIQWMIPEMGRQYLKTHQTEDFNRLIEICLKNNLNKRAETMIQCLFDYYYIHENIERCSAIVKYSMELNSPLTEEQQRRYLKLLLKSKDSVTAKSNVKKPQNIKYKF